MAIYDERNGCIKCGGQLVSTKYIVSMDAISRKCQRCGYQWFEEPIVRKAKGANDT